MPTKVNEAKMVVLKISETMMQMMTRWNLMSSQAMLREAGKNKEIEIKVEKISATSLSLKVQMTCPMRTKMKMIGMRVNMQLSKEITVSLFLREQAILAYVETAIVALIKINLTRTETTLMRIKIKWSM